MSRNPWEEHWKILSESYQQDAGDDNRRFFYDALPNVDEQLPRDAEGEQDAAIGGEERAEPVLDEQVIVDIQRQNQRPERHRRSPDRLGVVRYDAAHPLRGENLVIQPWWPNYPRQQQ